MNDSAYPTIPSSATDEITAAELDAQQRRIADLERHLEIAEDHWRRSAADLDNLRKRYQREVRREQRGERERVLGILVTLIDDLQRALGSVTDADGTRRNVIDGIESIARNADAKVAEIGYPRFGTVGDTFDPRVHEVIGTADQIDPPSVPVVVAVAKHGYGSADQLLRPASVIVTRQKTEMPSGGRHH